MSDEKVFIAGMIYKAPHPNAPDFVKGSLSVKVSEFTEFAKQNEREGWLNIDLKESKSGKLYAELNTFKPSQGQSARAGMEQARQAIEPTGKATGSNDFDDDIPF